MNYLKLTCCVAMLCMVVYVVQAQNPCSGGTAAGYPCDGIDLLSFTPLSTMNSSASNDIWGWTSPNTGSEYVLLGLRDGTAFFNIDNPVNPLYLGKLPTHTVSSNWRDVKVYNNHAFIVSEAGGHGMQVFNLLQLDGQTTPQTRTETAFYNSAGNGATFGSAHNIVINEASGYAYVVGAGACSGGLLAVNINNPTNPVFAGCFSGDGYTHDAQCVDYIGPDPQYQGAEICFNSNTNTLTIVDVSDKTDMTQISRTGYPGVGYTHQGWTTDDQKYFLMNDEFDESNFGFNTRTHIWNIQDLDNPVYIDYFESSAAAIDHNLYIKGNTAYMSNYQAGLRVIDISNIASGNLTETAYFDTYPSSNGAAFNGTWSNYPYFASGVIAVSGIDEGLFLLKLSNTTATCSDGIQNGNETGIDCGGNCPPCPATCDDGIQNGNETGIDCGGNCPPCPATCDDGIQNGNETGIDCGGNCPPCPTGNYCASQGNNANYEHIEAVTFAGINNTSGNDGGYADYTAQTATVEPEQTYTISLTPGFAGTIYNEAWKVWIDWNQDGDFDDSGEEVLSESGTSTLNSDITIPVSASSGTTRMRVSMQWNDAPPACGGFQYGEVEDYTIKVGDTGGCTVGASCDDEDVCTDNDAYDANCKCVGTFLDSDGDGICNANDECPNDPTNTCNTPEYCSSQGGNTSYEYIQTVTFAGINNASGNDGGYGDYTSQTATVSTNGTYNISLTPGFSGTSYNEAWKVWIDLNRDGDFDDSGEELLTQSSSSAINADIMIPASASIGTTGMRVSMQWNNAAPACGGFQYGEVEDYTINITNGNKITDQPVINIANYPNPFNSYTNIEFSISGDSPVTLQVYDLAGRQVATLLDNELTTAGEHRIRFDGSQHPSGMYMYTLQAGEYTAAGKMNIIK